jgi:hypothetical protein
MYVPPTLAECHFAIVSFDLWMFKKIYGVFALVINYLGSDWQPKHVTIGLFEAIETTSQTFAKNLT